MRCHFDPVLGEVVYTFSLQHKKVAEHLLEIAIELYRGEDLDVRSMEYLLETLQNFNETVQ